MTYKVASFFSGIGGFDLGLERAGMEVVFQCEVNKFCREILSKHWPRVLLKEDITKITVDDIPLSEVWCAGFPCQDVSLANQGKRKGINGHRTGLFFTFAELINERKPDWIILENVPGLLNSNEGRDFRVVLNTLDELGYGVSWRVFDAKYFGTPQRRRRVFIVASLGDLRSHRVLFEDKGTQITTRASLGEEEIFTKRYGRGNTTANYYSIQHASIGRKASAGPQAKGYRNDGETYTLDSRGSADVVFKTHAPFRVRKTTRLSEGLDSKRLRALGNAVAVPIVEWIGKRIVQTN